MTDEKKPKIKVAGMSIEAKGPLTKKEGAEAETKPAAEKKIPDITARDVAARDFTQRVKGYDPQEVKEFLEAVAVKMAALEEELRTLMASGGGGSPEAAAEIASLKARIETLEKEKAELTKKASEAMSAGEAPDMAAKIIKHAEELAEKIKSEAEEEAKARLRDLELELSRRRKELEDELESLRNETERLSHLKEDFIGRVEQTLREFSDIITRYKAK
ncbi:MAG: DivIVA domain-containing protein [Candidatus Hydrothermia bacterium]